MNLVLEFHGLIRWLVLAAAAAGLIHVLVAFGRFAAGSPRLHRILGGIFLGLVDLQFLLGVVILIGLPEERTEGLVHGLLMLAAVALAHVLRLRVRKAPVPQRARWALALFVGPLALILAGLAALP